jgi:peptide/nickel transport system permease protein
LAAFMFLLTLVLSANIFADAVQEAFDPRMRRIQPRRPGKRAAARGLVAAAAPDSGVSAAAATNERGEGA